MRRLLQAWQTLRGRSRQFPLRRNKSAANLVNRSKHFAQPPSTCYFNKATLQSHSLSHRHRSLLA